MTPIMLRGRKSRFPQLYDADWLRQKYVVEKLTTCEIEAEVGCAGGRATKALKKVGIPLRTSGESNRELRLRRGFSRSKYQELNNKEWLIQKYLIEEKSADEIARIIGAKDGQSIILALQGHGIKHRSLSEAQRIQMGDDHFRYHEGAIVGGLLGDASIRIKNKKNPVSCPSFRKKNKHYNHIFYVARLLFAKDPQLRIIPEPVTLKNGKRLRYWLLYSKANEKLFELYRKWYPESNGYKKLVPSDLELTPDILLHWFLDDGYSSYQTDRLSKKHSREKIDPHINTNYISTIRVAVAFCSQSFSKEDQERLVKQMMDKFGIAAYVAPLKVKNNGSGWLIRVRQSNSNIARFFEVIGPCPVEIKGCLGYKWKQPAPGFYETEGKTS